MAAPALGNYDDFWSECMKKIRILSEFAWERKCQAPEVERWLECFDGRSGFDRGIERIHVLHLLSNFLFFGHDQICELLRAMYRDVFQYRVVEKIRRRNHDSTDSDFIRRRFRQELSATRFVLWEARRKAQAVFFMIFAKSTICLSTSS